MNMSEKREERAKKKLENDNEKVFPKAQINWYPGHMAKAKRLIKENLEYIDVVFEVIDARMPYSSKIKDIDELIKNKPKVLVVTKTDLCDLKETNKWLNYYKEKGYKIAAYNLESNAPLNDIFKLTNELLEEKNEKRTNKGLLKRRSRVLVVGIPNVGKSTLINRLVGKKATTIGNRPGITKQLNWIRINSELELLDTPGILWPKLDTKKIAFNLASLTAIKEEVLPISAVCEYILNTLYDYYPEKLKERYDLNKIDEDIVDTFDKIGKRRGCLIRGGGIDYDKVIALIINDVKNGLVKNITFDRIEDYE